MQSFSKTEKEGKRNAGKARITQGRKNDQSNKMTGMPVGQESKNNNADTNATESKPTKATRY